MRTMIAGQSALSVEEFAELALGVDTELFAGPASAESALERAARLAAAADILADLRRDDPELADYAERLLNLAALAARETWTGTGAVEPPAPLRLTLCTRSRRSASVWMDAA